MQGGKPVQSLTELEGAILSEILHRGPQTAFRVRRSFAQSPSLEWRGSAGATYSAIARLERAGLLRSESLGDKRASRILHVTEAGVDALLGWACDVDRAISVGVDPFRLRAGLWDGLPEAQAAELLKRLRDALTADIAALRGYSNHDDAIEGNSVDLAARLQRARLDWIDARIRNGRYRA